VIIGSLLIVQPIAHLRSLAIVSIFAVEILIRHGAGLAVWFYAAIVRQ
jgi:hypothetical protein